MKKTALFIVLLALCLLTAPFAVAEGQPVARSDAFAAYVDGQGHLYLPGRTEAINVKTADNVLGIDAYRVLYLSPDEFLDSQDLYMVDLQSLEESLISTDVKAACLADDDTAYYVTGAKRTQLNRVDLHSLGNEVVYTAAEPIDRLYMSAEGLIVELVDGAGTMLYMADTGRFDIYNGGMPRSGATSERYEAYLTDASELYLKSRFNYTTSLVDTDVTAFTWLDNTLYYITRTGSALRLKAYDAAAKTSKVVLTPGVKMKDQLTASGKSLFMLAADNTVCRVDIAKGTLGVFKRYSDLSAYDLPAEYNVDGLRIEGMSGQLNVYAQLTDKTAKPTFSFIEFESEGDAAAPVLRLIDTLKLKGEQNAWEKLKPTPQYATLSRGSRGDAVSAIQQPLKDLGYYDYYVDGIYGPRTQAAVQLLQSDLGRPVTGVADAELQRIILSGKLGAYDPYSQLTRGNRGMRVRQMQERLRELGYLADAADGIFGPRTLKAVQLFQDENGLPEATTATRETLKRLYSDRAAYCSSYIDLYPGDTGYRVRELNNRLRDLYYLECSPGSTYTSQTASAVRVFQRTAGLRETSHASAAMQRLLFSDEAPEASGYIVLRRGDNNQRVARLQRRLMELGYYDGPVDGYFGRQTKEAVALFQRKVGLKPTGVATVRTQMLLFSDDAPEYVKPTYISDPDIYVEDYDYVDRGIYYISEASTSGGYVIFDWDVEGDVDHFNVRVSDSRGNVYFDNDTQMTSTGVSIATLDFDVVYTLRVRAYPADGNRSHVTEGNIRFVRIDTEPEEEAYMIDTVGLPEIDMSIVARIENGVRYLLPGTITFDWYAEGNVGSYEVRIEDESGAVLVDDTMSNRSASISSNAMNAGEIYTITVYAIPENGSIRDARANSALFALPEVELPEPDPTPEPVEDPDEVIEVDVEVEVEDEDEDEDEPEEILEPMPTFEPVEELVPDPTEEPEDLVADPTEAPEELIPDPTEQTDVEVLEPDNSTEQTDEETLEPDVDQPESLEPDTNQPETLEPDTDQPESLEPDTDQPESLEPDTTQPESLEPDTTQSETLEPDTDQPETLEPDTAQPEEGESNSGSVTAPVITLDYVQEERDGISYVSGDILTMSWQSEGNVGQYKIELQDTNGNVLDSRMVENNSLSAHTSGMDPNMVYTLVVTAIPVGGAEADGATSSITFALYTGAAAEDDSLDNDDENDDGNALVQDDDEDANDDEWQNAEEEYQESEEADGPSDDDDSGEDYQQNATEAYQEPEQEESLEPEQDEAYQEPEEDYQEPENDYQKPEDDYQEPEDDYQEPEDDYQEPEDDYQEPEQDYSDDSGEYYSKKQPVSEGEGIDVEDVSAITLTEEQIAAMQTRLVSLGWLVTDAYTPGLLDEATANAISSFQSYCNETFAMELTLIDTMDPVLDAETLTVLKDADQSYANPNPNPSAGAGTYADEGQDDSSDENPDEGYEDNPDDDYEEDYEEDADM